MANAAQGFYAPLPQSISDSDSEKESMDPKSMNGGQKNMTNGYMVPNHAVLDMSEKEGFRRMPLSAKIIFLSSILLCFLTALLFLYLPCTGTCPRHISNWDNEREDFEYTGKINVVASAFPQTRNLALLIRKSLVRNNDSTNGAISIIGRNGEVAWLIPKIHAPLDLNCYLIDVNNDGNYDCLLLGKTGLEAVDPISGGIYYYVHNPSADKKNLNNIDMPVVIPDLNKDGVKEMITTINGKSYHNKLVIISGKTGVLLSKIVLKQCAEVKGLKFEGGNFVLACKNNVTVYFKLPLSDIENRFNNKSFEVNPIKIDYSEPKPEYKLKNRVLIMNNTGICPDCSTNITLLDETRAPIWFSTHLNSYAMRPTSFSFKPINSKSLKGHLNGFIVKFWQYTDFKPKRRNFKRSLPVESKIIRNLINERVVLITFNETNVHVINASLTEITQLCFSNDDICQPSLENQEDSLKISDLDEDGSLELISYSSNYVSSENSWRLVSNMKVIRLEAELPKLYEIAK